jgi:hypothetical protein
VSLSRREKADEITLFSPAQIECPEEEKGSFAVDGVELLYGETRLAGCEGDPRTLSGTDQLCESAGDRQGSQQTDTTTPEQA